MRIEILQAGTGDCIWINHNKKNIVIDGGKSTTAIKARYAQMPQDEELDLLVVTHIDSDHIAGTIALVEMMKEKGETARLKQVWFNFPEKPASDEYSVPEGNELSSSICEIEGLKWVNNTSGLIGQNIEIGDIKLHVLAPDHNVSDEYKPKAPDELGVENADWDVNLQTLMEHVDDRGVFATSIHNEYSLVAAAMSKIMDEEGKRIYTDEEIYNYLSRIMQNGTNQRFGVPEMILS